MERDSEAGRVEVTTEAGFLLVIEGEADNWSGHVANLPIILAAGDTRGEVEQLLREGIAMYLEETHADDVAAAAPGQRA